MPVRALRTVGVVLCLLCAASCGAQGGRRIAKQFRRAQNIEIVDNKTSRRIATIHLSQDIKAMANALALGEAKTREQRTPAFTLVLVFPEGEKAKAYVDVDYRPQSGGEIRRGWVQCEGVGHVYPRELFWDVLDRHVIPHLPASRRPQGQAAP